MTELHHCEYCGKRLGQFNSRFLKEDGEDVGIWICPPCEDDLEDVFQNSMKPLSRPVNSEWYKYPRYGYVGDRRVEWFGDLDIATCPRCGDADIQPGWRVCTQCEAQINADDFS